MHELQKSFSACVQQAHNIIPEYRKNRTKISLAATAGMRLFIREYFRSTGFLFKDNRQVQIISGKEEALNAWISTNYIERNFEKVCRKLATIILTEHLKRENQN